MHIYVGPAKPEGAEEGGWCPSAFWGYPVGRGVAGTPPPSETGVRRELPLPARAGLPDVTGLRERS